MYLFLTNVLVLILYSILCLRKMHNFPTWKRVRNLIIYIYRNKLHFWVCEWTALKYTECLPRVNGD